MRFINVLLTYLLTYLFDVLISLTDWHAHYDADDNQILSELTPDEFPTTWWGIPHSTKFN